MRRLELRAEANYFRDKGEMTKTKEEITFTIIPIVLGVRYKVLEFNRLSPYLGAGVDFIFTKKMFHLDLKMLRIRQQDFILR
jgi:outer membrane protein W